MALSERFPNLRAELSRSGKNIGDIAKAIGCSQSNAYRYLNGQYNLSLEVAYKIRDSLFPNLGIEYLFSTNAENQQGDD